MYKGYFVHQEQNDGPNHSMNAFIELLIGRYN